MKLHLLFPIFCLLLLMQSVFAQSISNTKSDNNNFYPLRYKNGFLGNNHFIDERNNIVIQRNVSTLLKSNPDSKRALADGRVFKAVSMGSMAIGEVGIILGIGNPFYNEKESRTLLGGGIGFLAAAIAFNFLKDMQFRKVVDIYNTQHHFVFQPTLGITQNGIGLVAKW